MACGSPQRAIIRAWRHGRNDTRPGHAAPLRLSRRAAGLLRTGGAAFELTARMLGGRTGRGTVWLRGPKP